MHGEFGSHSMALATQLFFFLFFLCAIFSCFHTTDFEAYSFATDGYEIFNVRTHLGTCLTHEGGGGGVRHKRVCLRVDLEGQK